MKRLILVLAAVACLGVVGCGANSVQELKNDPGYHKHAISKYGYQESLKIIKDTFAGMQGLDLSCTIYADIKTGECTSTGYGGIFIFISTEYIDDNSSDINFYTAFGGAWRERIDIMSNKLTNNP